MYLGILFSGRGFESQSGGLFGPTLDGSLVSEVGRIRIRRDYILLDGGGQALAEATVMISLFARCR